MTSGLGLFRTASSGHRVKASDPLRKPRRAGVLVLQIDAEAPANSWMMGNALDDAGSPATNASSASAPPSSFISS